MNEKFLSRSISLINKLLTSSILILLLATTALGYKPPKNPSRPQGPVSSNSTRTNGCSGTAQTSLTLFAPISHIGQTVSEQPTFVWFVPDTEPKKMEFTLYEYGASGRGKKIKSVELQSTQGIMNFSLTKDKFKLSVGQKYLWQIALLCDQNNPAKDLVAELVIELVPMPPGLANQLARTTDSLKRAQIYDNAGFWYDALASTLEDPKSKALRLKMLTELSKSEAQAANNTSEQWLKKDSQAQAVKLQKIVAIEQQK